MPTYSMPTRAISPSVLKMDLVETMASSLELSLIKGRVGVKDLVFEAGFSRGKNLWV
ncbi:hypothetical protein [Pleomorphovibrio marinus]|uniref:hypothetical protein n=1 Tax=Pleomorphovibrio marinus TaxID=2164132 RepID=UPI0013003018|nr:hypothetical protein [Pleomorphovibrio marinus]